MKERTNFRHKKTREDLVVPFVLMILPLTAESSCLLLAAEFQKVKSTAD